jgi:hypothetical protein
MNPWELQELYEGLGVFGPEEQIVELDRRLREQYVQSKLRDADANQDRMNRFRCRAGNGQYWASRPKVEA